MTICSIAGRLRGPRVAVVLFVLPLTPAAAADVLFSNPAPFDNFGNCVFNTACGSNVWGAQEFSLGSSATVTSASYIVSTADPNFLFDVKLPTAVNWGVWEANGTNGLPGSLVVEGADDPIVSSQFLLNGSLLASRPFYQQLFDLPSVSLPAGNYYIGFQALNSDPGVYLSDGVLPSGAAAMWGSEWIATYDLLPSVAVSVYGTSSTVAAPEPETFGLFVMSLFALAWRAVARCRRASLRYTVPEPQHA